MTQYSRELEVEFSAIETLEMRAEGMPMTSPRLRTKRLDGFVKQWASSVWQRVFREVLVIQL
jgi:hypothetical protein